MSYQWFSNEIYIEFQSKYQITFEKLKRKKKIHVPPINDGTFEMLQSKPVPNVRKFDAIFGQKKCVEV